MGEHTDEKRERLYRAIERAQAFMHKRVPPDEMIRLVRGRFPAPVYFLESSRFALMRAGLSRLDAYYYSMIPNLTRTAACQERGLRPMLNTVSRMAEFLQSLYIGVHEERFYAVLLNNNGRLIHAALLQKGNEDSAPFYLRPVLTTALQDEAKYIVLAHNHPRGTLRPSREDLMCTLQALNAMAPLGVPLLDHIIVAGDRTVSIRQTGMLQELLWTAAAPSARIVRGWLDADAMSGDDVIL